MPEMDESDNSNVNSTIEKCQRISTTRDGVSQSWAGAPKTGFAPLTGGFTKGFIKKSSEPHLIPSADSYLTIPFVNPPAKRANPVSGALTQLWETHSISLSRNIFVHFWHQNWNRRTHFFPTCRGPCILKFFCLFHVPCTNILCYTL